MPPHEPQHQLLPDGMDVPVQVLDESVLSGVHDWSLIPASGLTFRDTVELETNPRHDVAQYKLIAGENRTIARNLFSLQCRSSTLFRVPCTIQTNRTFARDMEEAYYLDAMDLYLSQPPGPLEVNDIPFLKRPLKNRLFNSFARKPGYRLELFERRRLKTWIPYDVPANRHFGEAILQANYPKVEQWVLQLYLPPALAIPVSFVIFYYHRELRIAQIDPLMGGSERFRRLLFCLRKETHILAMAMWWNEVYFGGRMYVLEKATIDKLEMECGTVLDIGGMPAQAIIAHMRIVSDTPSAHHNWMCFDDRSMEPSTFVWGIKRSGVLDTTKPVRTRYYCRKADKRISTRKYGAPIWRGRSVMEERLSIPDLDKIEGLLGLIDQHEWQAHGSLRVSDLVYNLLNIYRSTHSKLADRSQALCDIHRNLDDVREDLRTTYLKLQDSRERSDFLGDRLRARDRQNHEMESRLRTQDIEIRDLRDQITTLRNVDSSRHVNMMFPTPRRQSGCRPVSEPQSPEYDVAENAAKAGVTGTKTGTSDGEVTTTRRAYTPIVDGIIQCSSHSRPSTPVVNRNPHNPAHSGAPSSSRPSTPNDSRRPRPGYLFYAMPPKRQKKNHGNNDSLNRTRVHGSQEQGTSRDVGSRMVEDSSRNGGTMACKQSQKRK